ncbi:3-hydroxy acyl-CoA dehydratase [Angomonas deanei]|uniref:very-long-chain (3R)-3-hydroxyacyl-CoA dehydratase n=1 Tax=Angomonas deanei TaxID=59799 RepID=A0A7G2CVP7_9TRYP|nr:3-hydroxy acyl-CoA dehydratase [Angomonas deanei]CAD2222493.1 Protein tyrosine phosphatase-like protein, PTPLA, putative [Angomonas deanei]|eukprot:EPY26678.1 3-hydroxy acyl-CoA dehydratase [Angomonas deanei]
MGGLRDAYLLLYNGGMCVGWATILAKIYIHLSTGGSIDTVYPLIEQLLMVCQTGAVAEIIHAWTGLVRSPVGTTFLQVLSRLLVLYGSLRIGETASRTNPMLVQMLTAWSLSEIIRYSFYTAKLVNKESKAINWLRYSGFMILYPVGITGEIGSLYNALPFIKENKPWSVELPNKWNFSFSWYNTVWFLLLGVYPYGSYVMYSYMLSQRRKAFAKQDKDQQAAKAE